MNATTEHVELPISGMTCASCANRVERNLNQLEGVSATVNYATEKARVEFDRETVAPEQLVDAVQAAGYTAVLPEAATQAPEAETAEPAEAVAAADSDTETTDSEAEAATTPDDAATSGDDA